MLKNLLEKRDQKFDLRRLENDLLSYHQMKVKMDDIKNVVSNLVIELKSVKSRDKAKAAAITARISRLKGELKDFKEDVWKLEETSLVEILGLPNWDETTRLEDTIVHHEPPTRASTAAGNVQLLSHQVLKSSCLNMAQKGTQDICSRMVPV